MMQSACSTSRNTIALRESENDPWMVFHCIYDDWYFMAEISCTGEIIDFLNDEEQGLEAIGFMGSSDMATEDAAFFLNALRQSRPSQ